MRDDHKDNYRLLMLQWQTLWPTWYKSSETTGIKSSDRRCLSELGAKFVSIVANNYDKNYITYTDALNYLSTKSKNFDKVFIG